MLNNRSRSDFTLLKPKRLQQGNTIGLLAPASHLDGNTRIEIAIETIQSLGFKVKEGRNLNKQYGYFAGTDTERANDINDFFIDPEIDGIMCLAGGWGSSRLLPLLDYTMIQKHPKVLMGFSDITALLNGIYAQSGLVSFHGPLAGTEFTSYCVDEFKKVVMLAYQDIALGNPPPFEKREGQVERRNRIRIIGTGTARGPLVGGNLSLVSHLVGTPYLPDLAGKILFLEDINEAVYRIDRTLTQLSLSGALDGIAGIIFGKFTDCSFGGTRARQFTLDEVLDNFCNSLGVPAISGLMIGHVADQTTLPIGCQVEVNTDKGRLQLLETAVT